MGTTFGDLLIFDSNDISRCTELKGEEKMAILALKFDPKGEILAVSFRYKLKIYKS